jgi:glycosyltransferase involved in cell wall biosynthesis
MIRTLTISLVTLGDPARLTGGYLYHRRMVDAGPEHGAHVEVLPVPERPFPLGALAVPRLLARVSSSDVLVVDSIAAAFIAPWLARRRQLPPVVGSLHQPPGGIDHWRARRRVQARLDLLVYGRSRLLVVASDALADEVVRAGVPRRLLRVVPPGCDVADGAVREALDLRRGRRVAILCAGNWVARKGILELLEAFARLPHHLATLHLVGDATASPAYGRRVAARLARRDLAGRVVVHGAVPPGRMAAFYAAADAFALASTREPFGTVYAEAMAAGLPVVGWRAGNLPHLADHGREGLHIAVGDIAGLAEFLRLLAEDDELRHRLSEAARRRAERFPRWADSCAGFFAALREAAEGR